MTGRYHRLPDRGALAWLSRDPTPRCTAGVVAIVAGTPEWPDIVYQLDHAVQDVPGLRDRYLPVPGRPGLVRGVPDGRFDLDDHVHRITLPQGTPDDLARLVTRLTRAPFDPARPWWELTVAEGLDGDRTALVLTAHEALLPPATLGPLDQLLDDSPRPARKPLRGFQPPDTAAETGFGLWRESLEQDLTAVARRTQATVSGLLPAVVRTVADPWGTARQRWEAWQPDFSSAPRGGSSPALGRPTGKHRHALRSVASAELDRVARSHHVDLGELLVAVGTAAYAGYHRDQGLSAPDVLTTVLGAGQDSAAEVGVRRFVVAGVPAGSGVGVRLEALRAVGTGVERGRPQNAEATAQGVVVEVTGPRSPRYLGGAPVTDVHLLAPVPGPGLGVTAVEYGDRCGLGVSLDVGVIPRPDDFLRCWEAALDDVLTL